MFGKQGSGSRKGHSGKQNKAAVLTTIGPYTAVILILVIVPLIYIGVLSIMTRPSYGGVVFDVSFHGYEALFEHAYLVAVWNSLKMSLISTVIILLVSYPMAFIFARCSRRVASNLIILMMAPYFTCGLVRLYSYITLLNANGPLNTFLTNIGLSDHPIQILYTQSSVILGLVYVCIPYAVLPMYSSIERLDDSILEASYDLGAGKVRTFFKVILPMTSPGIYAAAIISFVPSIGNYFIADVLGGSKTLLVGNLIKDQFQVSRNWPLGSALSVVLVIGTLILIYIYDRIANRSEVGGVF